MINKKYISSVFMFMAFVIIAFVIREFNNIRIRVGNESGLGCAKWTIRDALKGYYNKNGKYPAKLAELPNLVFQDEAFSGMKKADSNELLKKFAYKATDNSYELSTDFSYGSVSKIEKEFGENGKDIAWEFYKNGVLYERIEIPDKGPHVSKDYRDGKLELETVYDSNMNIISQKVFIK
jgi:hypothetical protein